MKLFASGLLALLFWTTLYWFRPVFASANSPGVAVLGTFLALSFFVFMAAAIGCRFYIDRKKVAESKFWLPLVADSWPPRKFLQPRGHVFAEVRWYSGILALVLMIGVLICAR